MTTVSDPAFWAGLYAGGGDRWELGGPAPPLVAYLASHPRLPGERVAVPGCGRGHDARLLAGRGYRVWGFDFAEAAIRDARALAVNAPGDVVFEPRDVFGLAADYRGAFDGLWEYTSFCAVDPARRPEYVEVVRALLEPDGWLLACFFPVRDGPLTGPPFPVTEAAIRRLFGRRFAFVETLAPRESAPGRAGREWMILARAHDAV